jgi:hypothetical protein
VYVPGFVLPLGDGSSAELWEIYKKKVIGVTPSTNTSGGCEPFVSPMNSCLEQPLHISVDLMAAVQLA